MTTTVFGALLIGASMIGFLVYSDRPGPGFDGLNLMINPREIGLLVSFLAFLTLPLGVVGAVVLSIELIYERLRLPPASIRLAGALAAGVLTSLVAASIGWYIALAGEAAGLALIVGALAAFILFPRRILPPRPPASWTSLARGTVL